MDEKNEQQDQPAFDWDQAFQDMLGESEEDKLSFIEGTLKLYSNPQGFEFHFKGDGGRTWAYPLTDGQAAELSLTIMTVIANR